MKIAIPVDEKKAKTTVCQSFGRTPFYMLYDSETGDVTFIDNHAAASQGGAGIKAAQAIADSGAKAVVTYRCGENAAEVLLAADVKMYKAQGESAMDNAVACANGALTPLGEIHPGFHGHKGAQA